MWCTLERRLEKYGGKGAGRLRGGSPTQIKNKLRSLLIFLIFFACAARNASCSSRERGDRPNRTFSDPIEAVGALELLATVLMSSSRFFPEVLVRNTSLQVAVAVSVGG